MVKARLQIIANYIAHDKKERSATNGCGNANIYNSLHYPKKKPSKNIHKRGSRQATDNNDDKRK